MIAVATLTFVSCGDDDDENNNNSNSSVNPVENKVNVSKFAGTFTVSYGDFSMDNVEVQTTCVDSTKLCNLTLKAITFSSQMPMKMDLMVDSISFSVRNGDTTLTGSNLNPTASMNGQTMNAGFAISYIAGKITNSKLTLTMDGTYTRMNTEMTLGYEGTRM